MLIYYDGAESRLSQQLNVKIAELRSTTADLEASLHKTICRASCHRVVPLLKRQWSVATFKVKQLDSVTQVT